MAKLWVLLAACFVKKDDPELLIPPADYDVEVLESSGFALCIDAHPTTAQVMVSSRQVSDCVQVKGEVFVEVSQEGFAPYRELLMVQGDLTHQVLLVPVLEDPSIPNLSVPTPQVESPEVPTIGYPMPMNPQTPTAFQQPSTSVQLCVTTEPADAYLTINGMKRTSGACMSVQNAAAVAVESEGYISYEKLLAIPPNQTEAFEYRVVLQPDPKYTPTEY